MIERQRIRVLSCDLPILRGSYKHGDVRHNYVRRDCTIITFFEIPSLTAPDTGIEQGVDLKLGDDE